jgi:putative FmdB family regulatory protein
MPIYEYVCSSCGYQKEVLQKISDPVLVDCPECGQKSYNKIVSSSSFQLKGEGWYETDFKTKKKPSETKASGDSK